MARCRLHLYQSRLLCHYRSMDLTTFSRVKECDILPFQLLDINKRSNSGSPIVLGCNHSHPSFIFLWGGGGCSYGADRTVNFAIKMHILGFPGHFIALVTQ